MKIAMCGYKGKTGSKVYQVLKANKYEVIKYKKTEIIKEIQQIFKKHIEKYEDRVNKRRN